MSKDEESTPMIYTAAEFRRVALLMAEQSQQVAITMLENNIPTSLVDYMMFMTGQLIRFSYFMPDDLSLTQEQAEQCVLTATNAIEDHMAAVAVPVAKPKLIIEK